VRLLFVPLAGQVWGTFDPDNRRVTMRPEPKNGDEDLLNLAAIEVAANGGTVYTVPDERVPGGGPVAAVFRY
jgi:hypothetical protein